MHRSHTFLMVACFAAALLGTAEAAHAADAVPIDQSAWQRLGVEYGELIKTRDYRTILERSAAVHEALLTMQFRRETWHLYMPTICIAQSLFQTGQRAAAGPMYERALHVRVKPHNVVSWFQCLDPRADPSAWEVALKAIRDGLTSDDDTFDFYAAVHRGDHAYLKGKRETAHAYYTRAEGLVARLHAASSRPARPGRALSREYTYQQLYRGRGGRARYDLYVRTFLSAKLAASKAIKVPKKRATYRVAVFVIRKTDITYRDGDATLREKSELSNTMLDAYKRAWTFATDAVEGVAEGRVKIESEWIELKNTTLRGLTDRNYKGLVKQRHLDPERLDPVPHKMFRSVAKTFDCVAFVWPRGNAAAAYGGGGIRLPGGKRGPLTLMGGIRSISPRPAVCLHELLHTIERRGILGRVHGPLESPMETFKRHGIKDELGWYAYLIRSVKAWKGVKYRHGR